MTTLNATSSIVRSDRTTIAVDGRRVPLVLRAHARAKGYRLRLGVDGTAMVTFPARGSARRALLWATEQAGWLAEQLSRRGDAPSRLADGAAIPLEGGQVIIANRPADLRGVRLEDGRLIVGGPAEHVDERVLRWLKARAKAVLTAETLALAAAHGLTVRAVGIGDPSSRWGSCSASGAIRYSWRLILAPPAVRIATVAHEVAHLRHLDHSAGFHAFHRAICSVDTVAARAWLRAHGSALHAVGR